MNTLKQEIYELEILNKHIKQENESLKEKNHLEKVISDNTILQLGIWCKKNNKMEKRNGYLNRKVISLKYKLLMKKPIMVITSRKGKKRNLDVLA